MLPKRFNSNRLSVLDSIKFSIPLLQSIAELQPMSEISTLSDDESKQFIKFYEKIISLINQCESLDDFKNIKAPMQSVYDTNQRYLLTKIIDNAQEHFKIKNRITDGETCPIFRFQAYQTDIHNDMTNEKNIEHEQKMEQSNDAYIGINAQSSIIFWNKAAHQLFGWSKEEVLHTKTLESTILPVEILGTHGVHVSNCSKNTPDSHNKIGLQREIEARKKGAQQQFPIAIKILSVGRDDSFRCYAQIKAVTPEKEEQKKYRSEQANNNEEKNTETIFRNLYHTSITDYANVLLGYLKEKIPGKNRPNTYSSQLKKVFGDYEPSITDMLDLKILSSKTDHFLNYFFNQSLDSSQKAFQSEKSTNIIKIASPIEANGLNLTIQSNRIVDIKGHIASIGNAYKDAYEHAHNKIRYCFNDATLYYLSISTQSTSNLMPFYCSPLSKTSPFNKLLQYIDELPSHDEIIQFKEIHKQSITQLNRLIEEIRASNAYNLSTTDICSKMLIKQKKILIMLRGNLSNSESKLNQINKKLHNYIDRSIKSMDKHSFDYSAGNSDTDSISSIRSIPSSIPSPIPDLIPGTIPFSTPCRSQEKSNKQRTAPADYNQETKNPQEFVVNSPSEPTRTLHHPDSTHRICSCLCAQSSDATQDQNMSFFSPRSSQPARRYKVNTAKIAPSAPPTPSMKYN